MPALIPIINKSLYKHSQNSLHLSHPDFPKERQRWRGRTHCCPHVRRRWTNYRVQMELTDSLRFQIEAYIRNPKILTSECFEQCVYINMWSTFHWTAHDDERYSASTTQTDGPCFPLLTRTCICEWRNVLSHQVVRRDFESCYSCICFSRHALCRQELPSGGSLLIRTLSSECSWMYIIKMFKLLHLQYIPLCVNAHVFLSYL